MEKTFKTTHDFYCGLFNKMFILPENMFFFKGKKNKKNEQRFSTENACEFTVLLHFNLWRCDYGNLGSFYLAADV